jgi:haloacid dehalogenase-like hydrolase
VADGGYASRLPARFDLVHLGLGADGHIASPVPGDRSIPAARVQARRSVIFADAPAVDGPPPTFQGAIFDIDGVLVDSPHVLATKAAGIPIAAASSSKNADLLLRQVRLDDYVAEKGLTLLDLLDADVSGRDLPRGKPDPMIFLVAAEELPATPARCFVVEDAAVGVQAAKAGGMAALGVARLGDEQAQQALADAARTWSCGRSTRCPARPWPRAGWP